MDRRAAVGAQPKWAPSRAAADAVCRKCNQAAVAESAAAELVAAASYAAAKQPVCDARARLLLQSRAARRDDGAR